MNSLTQDNRKINITVDSNQASDIISSLSLFARIHPGEVSARCQKLLDYLWAQSFHDLGKGWTA